MRRPLLLTWTLALACSACSSPELLDPIERLGECTVDESSAAPADDEPYREHIETLLLAFEREQGYDIPQAKLLIEDTDDMFIAVRTTRDEKRLSAMPSAEGTVVGTAWIKPRSPEARDELEQGLYQLVMLPDGDPEGEFVQIGLRAGADQKFSAYRPYGHRPMVVDRPLFSEECLSTRGCTTVEDRMFAHYQARANARCRTQKVMVNCQLRFRRSGYCFTITRVVTVPPNNQATCPLPAGGYPVDHIDATRWF